MECISLLQSCHNRMTFVFLRVDRIDFIVHGDDPCIVDGKDVYETAQKLGK